MFALYEAQQIAGWFSKPIGIGNGRIRRGLVFSVAMLLALGASGQVVRAANGNLDPTFANGGSVLNATPVPEPTHTPRPEPTHTPGATVTPRPTETPEPEPTHTPRPEPTHTPRPTETPRPSETPEPEPTHTPRPEPTHTPRPTETPRPSETPEPEPTHTPRPSETPRPTETPEPTHTPRPEPTHTPRPTPTPGATPHATATPRVAVQPLNISTRLHVEAGENVAIGGFMITGSSPKRVAIRGMGPSLQSAGFVGTALSDPTLELRDSGNSLIASNDNWRDNPVWAAELQATGLAPTFDFESAIVATLSPGAYTAIVGGKNGSTGMGLVEIYDLDPAGDAQLANISTRGLVRTGDSVVIGGFILGGDTGQASVLLRAIGPSLTAVGVANALANPTLELRDSNGVLLQYNDNWKDSQQAAIEATGVPPQNDLESAILATLLPGSYTAIAAGKDGSMGVGLIEVYNLPPQ